MKMNGNGTTSPWQESEAGQQVQARLADPHTLEALDRLLQRIDTLERAVGQLSDLMQRGPGMVAMLGDMADETYRQLDAAGISVDDRLRQALTLAEILTAPATVQKMEAVVQLSHQLPGMAAMLTDMVDEGARTAIAEGLDPHALGQVTAKAATALSEASAQPPAQVGGIFSLLRALKDPDRQRGMGFLLNFLKIFGQQLQKQS